VSGPLSAWPSPSMAGSACAAIRARPLVIITITANSAHLPPCPFFSLVCANPCLPTPTFRFTTYRGFSQPSSLLSRSNSVSLGPFTVSPAAFSAEQGGRIDVEIAFAAAGEGKITAPLLLVTDNGEFTAVTLGGRSEVASVSFTNASVPCTPGSTPRDSAAHLGSTYPGERRVANFHFANDTRGSLPYEWVVCHPQPVPQLQLLPGRQTAG